MLAPNPVAPMPEGMPAPRFHDVTIVIKKKTAQACVLGVPPEEFGIARNARSLRDCGYCFHETPRRQEDLIAEGFDKDQIDALPTYTPLTTSEEMSRDTVDETRDGGSGDELNRANRQIKITEHYLRMDYEGKGKVCLYRITTGGDQSVILKRNGKDEIIQEEVIPFAAITPVPMPHRFFGRSVADLVMDIQRIKTALLRGMLDNAYMVNTPRTEVSESHASENTLDDLLVSRPNGIVRTKQPGGLKQLSIEPIADKILPIVQYLDSTREWRTGVSRAGQGLDADALQNQSATAANQLFTAAQARMKLIARIFAETGIRDLFSLLHAVIRKHGQKAQTVRLRNQWVQVDPREWKSRNDMTIKVGLGTGGKSEQLVGTQLLIGAQEKGIAAGMVSKRNLFNSAKQLTKLLGHQNVEEYFTDPSKPPEGNDPAAQPIQPPQDPKLQIEGLKLQHSQEVEKLKQAGNVNEAQLRAQLDREKAHAETVATFSKTQADASLAAAKAEFDAKLAILEHSLKERELMLNAEFERQKHALEMRHAEEKHQAALELAKHKTTQKPKGD